MQLHSHEIRDLYNSGIITLNEARQLLGLPDFSQNLDKTIFTSPDVVQIGSTIGSTNG